MTIRQLTSVAILIGALTLGACSKDDEDDKVNDNDLHEYVDLGLPSGTLWATCNVGANKPEEYGLYFAWGETIGYRSDTSDGHQFNWTTYKWCKGAENKITKYCVKGNYGTVDNKIDLEDDDDAATVNWSEVWHMPTIEQVSELLNSEYTTITKTKHNGVNGRKIVSKKNGNYIFLPAAGYRYDSKFSNGDSGGYYWYRSLSSSGSDKALILIFGTGVPDCYSLYRYYGASVRPVRPPKK
jgi:hypothetical protein